MKKPHIQWPEQWLRRKRIPSIGFSYSGKDFIISMSLYTLSVVLCLILRGASQDGDTGYVYMIFLLDVFLTALLTEGFFFSLIISIFAVLSVDYIFTPPYWNVSFTLSGFPLTFLVTMTISVVTGIVTSRAKQMDEVRREAELERMHGNLLRAVSHDIRTPLTGIVGATNVLLEQENTLTPEQRERFDVALDRWLKSAVRAELLAWPCVRAEVPFFSLGCEDKDIARYGAYAEGAIDALATDPADPSRALAIDYKTGGTPDETPDQLFEKHALQARVYSDVLHKAGFKTVTVKFVRVEQSDPSNPAESQVVTYNL